MAPPLSRAIVREDLIVNSRTSSFSSSRLSLSSMTSSRFFTSRAWPFPLFEGSLTQLAQAVHFALDDLGLPDVPTCVEASRHERERLFRDRLGFLERRGDADHREGPRCRRVYMTGFFVDASIEQLCPGAADALLVDLELLTRLRVGPIAHRHDVLAHGCLPRELDRRWEISFRQPHAKVDQVVFENRQDVHGFRVREADVVLEELRAILRGHETAIENALERRAAVRHRCDGLQHDLEGSLEIVFRDEGQDMIRIAVRSHSTRVRTSVSLVGSLVILRERSGSE